MILDFIGVLACLQCCTHGVEINESLGNIITSIHPNTLAIHDALYFALNSSHLNALVDSMSILISIYQPMSLCFLFEETNFL